MARATPLCTHVSSLMGCAHPSLASGAANATLPIRARQMHLHSGDGVPSNTGKDHQMLETMQGRYQYTLLPCLYPSLGIQHQTLSTKTLAGLFL